MPKPELRISILSDYICPFCYIGSLRLDALRDEFDLKVNWCFIEIHPETPREGHSVRQLNYSNEQWDSMMTGLRNLAKQEGITLSEQTMIANSRKALLLSEATKALGADRFYPLHEAIFHAYFVEGRNIGDETVLRQLAREHQVPDELIERAWNEDYADGPADEVPPSLLRYLQYAGYLNATSVPTLVIGNQAYSGVLSREHLLQLARTEQAQSEHTSSVES